MKLATVLSGQAFIFRSLKEVLAKANELKSGDVLAGVAASSDLERIAAKEVLSQLLLSDLRNHPVVPYEEDEVTRINQDGIDETVYQRIKNWTVAELREYILSHETTEDDIHLLSKGLTSEMVAAVCKLMTNMELRLCCLLYKTLYHIPCSTYKTRKTIFCVIFCRVLYYLYYKF